MAGYGVGVARFHGRSFGSDLSGVDWAAGLCHASGDEFDQILFPDRVGERARTMAAAFCRACPIQQECETYAIDHPEIVDGFWGGFDAGSRGDRRVKYQRMRRKQEEARNRELGRVRQVDPGNQVPIVRTTSLGSLPVKERRAPVARPPRQA